MKQARSLPESLDTNVVNILSLVEHNDGIVSNITRYLCPRTATYSEAATESEDDCAYLRRNLGVDHVIIVVDQYIGQVCSTMQQQ